MSDIDRVITLTNVFNKDRTTFELDLQHVRGIRGGNLESGIYTTYVDFVNPDGELEILLVKDDDDWTTAKWIREQYADYRAARDHEAAGQSTAAKRIARDDDLRRSFA